MGEGNKKRNDAPKVTRRIFLKSVGISSVGVAAAKGDGVVGKLEKAGLLEGDVIVGPGKITIELLVNGKKVSLMVKPQTTLADALRNELHMTGTKIGCNRGSCGACTVLMDGMAISSCMTLALDAVGKQLETIEGLSHVENTLHPLQQAFVEHDAYQCGFCTSGMIMSAKDLLDHNSNPNLDDIKNAVSGNICRCGTYPHVFKAIETAAKK